MERIVSVATICFFLSAVATSAEAPPFTVGGAPKGNPTLVAGKIIKQNFPTCKKVRDAERRLDGSIKATCDGVEFLVFTVFDTKRSRTIELAMNCSVAKQRLNIAC